MTDEEFKFNKECIEKIPPAELRSIHDRVLRIVDLARFSPAGPLPMGYCDKCPGDGKFRLRQPCFIFLETHESLCAYHFVEKRERELCKEYLEALKPKKPFPVAELKYGSLVPLDVEDFSRI